MQQFPTTDDKPKRTVTSDRIFAVLAIAAGVFLFAVSDKQIDKPLAVFGATPMAMLPDVYPRMMAILLALVGAILLWFTRTVPDSSVWTQTSRSGYTNAALSILILAVYSQLVMPLGFVLASVALIFVLGILYGSRNYVLSAVFAVAVPLAIFNLFRNVMAVPLPEQPFLPPLFYL